MKDIQSTIKSFMLESFPTGSPDFRLEEDTSFLGSGLIDSMGVLELVDFLEGEFGIDGVFVGVPCILGAGGMEKVWELNLSESEQAELKASAAAVQELVDILGI